MIQVKKKEEKSKNNVTMETLGYDDIIEKKNKSSSSALGILISYLRTFIEHIKQEKRGLQQFLGPLFSQFGIVLTCLAME